MGRGRPFLIGCDRTVTRWRGHSGRWAWTRPSSVPTSTRPEPVGAHPLSQGALPNYKIPGAEHDRESLGRSRGGLSTKIHLAADRRCRPIARVITAGHRNDVIAFEPVMTSIRIARARGGRPRTRPGHVLADKAYSSRGVRTHLRRRKIRATIPEPEDQIANRARRGSRGGRRPSFEPERYKQRNVVERCISKLKAHRAFATRTDKREYMFEGTVDVATIRIWLRDLTK